MRVEFGELRIREEAEAERRDREDRVKAGENSIWAEYNLKKLLTDNFAKAAMLAKLSDNDLPKGPDGKAGPCQLCCCGHLVWRGDCEPALTG